jgi:hypothetical protein
MSLTAYSNLKPKLIENLFTEEEYQNLYNQVAESSKIPDDVRVIDELGYTSTSLYLNDTIKNVLWEKIETELGIKTKECWTHYARYSLQSGHKPLLMPHYDRALTKAMFSLAIVLDSTFNWDIYVEGEKFVPRKNDGVLFSGSHQVHWRPDVEFKEDDYYDIMVCQFEELTDEDRSLSKEHKETMDERNGLWCLEWERLYDVETYNKKMNYNRNNE